MQWWKSPETFPARIFIVALILRMITALALSNLGIGLDDMFQYDMLARSIVAGNGYRWYAEPDLPLIEPYFHLDLNSADYDPRGVLTSFRPPLYPTFLALIYLFAGVGARRFFVARLVQAFLAASLAPLTYALARRLFPGSERAARIPAWCIAMYPMLVIYPLSLATENLFFVLVLCATISLLKAKESSEPDGINAEKQGFLPNRFLNGLLRARWFILAGILLGLMSLTRSVSLFFSGLAVLWIWFILRKKKMALVVFTMVTVVTLPWMIRNTLLHGRLTGIESALGYDLYLGYHPQGTGTFQYPQSKELMPILDDGLRDQLGRKMAWNTTQANPDRIPYLIIRRAGYFFGLERRALTYFYSNNFFGCLSPLALGSILILFCLPFVFVSTSGVLGLALMRWREETWLMALFLVGYILPHLLIIAEDRFHLTAVPFLAILAAQFWTGGWKAIQQRWKESRSGKVALLLAAIAILFLLANWGLELWRDADKLVLLFGPNGNRTYFSY